MSRVGAGAREAGAAKAKKETDTEGRATVIAATIVAGAAVLAGLTLLPRISASRIAAEEDRQPAPAFNLPVIAQGEPGSRLALEEMKGSPVLLDFWASWCGACSMQAPIVDRLARRYQDRGLKVVSINVLNDDHALAAKMGSKFPFPVVLDDTGLASKSYGADSLPTMVLIDKEGRIVKKTRGVVDESTLDRMVREVL